MMIGYHSSQEQFKPSDLLNWVTLAEARGFDSVMTADHFNPWSEHQGQSGFTWSWLGSALERTEKISFGSLAIPGGWRYHPAVLAQIISTLCEMYPKRLQWIAAGSGEALNEMITGEIWPSKKIRKERLYRGVEIMRELFAGKTVNDETGIIPTREAKLWTRAEDFPQIFIPVLSSESARWGGEWAEGLITVNQDKEKLKSIIKSFQSSGGRGRPIYLQLHLSWHQDQDICFENAYQEWRSNAISGDLSQNLNTPVLYQAATSHVRREDMHEFVRISHKIEDHIRWIKEYQELGFDGIFLHNVGKNQEEFIKVFGEEVISEVKK